MIGDDSETGPDRPDMTVIDPGKSVSRSLDR